MAKQLQKALGYNPSLNPKDNFLSHCALSSLPSSGSAHAKGVWVGLGQVVGFLEAPGGACFCDQHPSLLISHRPVKAPRFARQFVLFGKLQKG